VKAIGILAAGLALLAARVPVIGWSAVELGSSVRSAWTSPRQIIYSDSAAFRRGWSDLFSTASMRPALPVINFNALRVLVVAAGSKPSGGYTIRLDSARATRDSALIYVSLRTPPPGCGVTQEITSPAVAIAVPNVPKRLHVITRERPDSVRCTGHT